MALLSAVGRKLACADPAAAQKRIVVNNYSDVAVFVRVAEHQSFVNAAASLSVTPSAISKAVSRLEQRLGVRLLNRSTRALRMTDLGMEYFQTCRAALDQLDKAGASAIDANLAPSGTLRIEAPTALGRHLLLPALPKFLSVHSNIRVQLTLTEGSGGPRPGGADVAIRVGLPQSPELVARRVGKVNFVTCASPEFLAMHGLPVSPSDLAPTDCIALLNACGGRMRDWHFARAGRRISFTPASHLALSDPDSAVAASLAGAGFIQVHDLAVRPSIEAGLLTTVLRDWATDSSEVVYVVYQNHRQRSSTIGVFTEFVASLLPRPAGLARLQSQMPARREQTSLSLRTSI